MQVLRGVLSADELAALRDALADAPFEDGKLTASGLAARVKHNLQMRREDADASPFDQLIAAALARHPLLQAWALPKRITAPLFSRYDPGMAYGAHVDSPLMGQGQPIRSDLSITVFLNEPAEYDGGELLIETPGSGDGVRVKLPAGDAIIYPTFSLHQVLPVTRGVRLVAVTWVQSLVRDPMMRQVLFDLHAASRSLMEREPDAIETRLVQKAHNNLMRLVIEP